MKYEIPHVEIHRYAYSFCKILIAFMFFQLNANAQNPTFVDQISFDIVESSKLVLPKYTTFEEIDPEDIPALEYQEKTTSKNKYFDSSGNPQIEETLINAVNFYEDWQGLPSKWLMNQDGITAYKQLGANGPYESKGTIPHSQVGEEMYEGVAEYTNSIGFLGSLVYPRNIQEYMNEKQIHYTVGPDGSLIRQNEQFYISYKLMTTVNGYLKGIITEYEYYDPNSNTGVNSTNDDDTPSGDNNNYPLIPNVNDPNVKYVSIAVFDIIQCEEIFMSSKMELTKVVLVNGLCAKRVVEQYYSNYSFECENSRNRSIVDNKTSGDITVYPNPLSSDLLRIKMPSDLMDLDYEMQISDINGKSILHRNGQLKESELSVNLGSSLGTDGIYIVSIICNNQIFTKNFYYLKN